MVSRRTTAVTRRAAAELGANLAATRKLLDLTAQQVAERANISRSTLQRLEAGEPGVRMDVVLEVVRVLGGLERLLTATDPYETDLGRARANQILPQRIRR